MRERILGTREKGQSVVEAAVGIGDALGDGEVGLDHDLFVPQLKLEGSQRLPGRAVIVVGRDGIAHRCVGDQDGFGVGEQGMQFHAAPWVQRVWWIIAPIGEGGKEAMAMVARR